MPDIPAAVMTVKDVADYMKVHPSTIYRLLRKRQLPAFRIGSDWRFNVEEVDRWCKERQMHPDA